jgi:hypothetical protein
VFTIQLGAPTSISIIVPADYGKAISEVDVTNAPGFDLQAGEPPKGWTVTRAGDSFVFSGGLIALNEFAVFAIRGVATTKGELLFPVTTHSPDGSVMRYSGQPGSTDAGAIVYAGVVPHLPSRGVPWGRIGGGAVLGLGVLVTGLIVVRRRRQAVMGGPDRPHASGHQG